MLMKIYANITINPLSHKSDKHQVSPHNTSTQSREKFMRITGNEIIT